MSFWEARLSYRASLGLRQHASLGAVNTGHRNKAASAEHNSAVIDLRGISRLGSTPSVVYLKLCYGPGRPIIRDHMRAASIESPIQ